jgi:hypothetical protein
MLQLHTRRQVSLWKTADFFAEKRENSPSRRVIVQSVADVCAVLRFAIMGRLRALVRASIAALGIVLAVATPAFAQLTPAPVKKGGLCAPWHECVAYGVLAIVVLYLLMTAAMYAFQRRGFDKVEHRQGNPEGVAKSGKE